jgi:hypothetical protein
MRATSPIQQPHFYGSLSGDVVSLNPSLIPVQARYERIAGIRETAYSETWGSAWLDIKEPRKFNKGDHLQITLRDDSAKRILVRFLQSGHKVNDCTDVFADGKIIPVPSSRIVDLVLDKDYPETV